MYMYMYLCVYFVRCCGTLAATSISSRTFFEATQSIAAQIVTTDSSNGTIENLGRPIHSQGTAFLL